MPQCVWRAAHANYTGFTSVALHQVLHTILGEGITIPGEENKVIFRQGWFWTALFDILPEAFLNPHTKDYKSLFSALAPDLSNAFFEVKVVHLQACYLRKPG